MNIETWYRGFMPNYVMGFDKPVTFSPMKLQKEPPAGFQSEAVEVYVDNDGNFVSYVEVPSSNGSTPVSNSGSGGSTPSGPGE